MANVKKIDVARNLVAVICILTITALSGRLPEKRYSKLARSFEATNQAEREKFINKHESAVRDCINFFYRDDRTNLAFECLRLGDIDSFIHLLHKDAIGLNPYIRTPRGNTVLHVIASAIASDEVITLPGTDQTLIEHLCRRFPRLRNARNNSGMTPLHVAAHTLNYPAVRQLLNAGADIHALDDFGNSVVHACVTQSLRGTSAQKEAAVKKTQAIVRYLLYRGCVPSPNYQGESFVQRTAKFLGASVAKELDNELKLISLRTVKALATDSTGKDFPDKRNVLHQAAQMLNVAEVKRLLASGVSVLGVDLRGNRPMHYLCMQDGRKLTASQSDDFVKIAWLLFTYGDRPGVPNDDGLFPIQVAMGPSSRQDKTFKERRMIDNIVDGDLIISWQKKLSNPIEGVGSGSGDSPAQLESFDIFGEPNNPKIFISLADAPAAIVSLVGIVNDRSLSYHAKQEKLNELLPSLTLSDINYQDAWGRNLLFFLLDNHFYEQVATLAQTFGTAAIRVRDAFGMTPLHAMCRKGIPDDLFGDEDLAEYEEFYASSTKCLEAIIENLGSNWLNARDISGRTALFYAADNNNDMIFLDLVFPEGKMGLRSELVLSCANDKGDYPLTVAIQKGFLTIVKTLIANGLTLYDLDSQGMTIESLCHYVGGDAADIVLGKMRALSSQPTIVTHPRITVETHVEKTDDGESPVLSPVEATPKKGIGEHSMESVSSVMIEKGDTQPSSGSRGRALEPRHDHKSVAGKGKASIGVRLPKVKTPKKKHHSTKKVPKKKSQVPHLPAL